MTDEQIIEAIDNIHKNIVEIYKHINTLSAIIYEINNTDLKKSNKCKITELRPKDISCIFVTLDVLIFNLKNRIYKKLWHILKNKNTTINEIQQELFNFGDVYGWVLNSDNISFKDYMDKILEYCAIHDINIYDIENS